MVRSLISKKLIYVFNGVYIELFQSFFGKIEMIQFFCQKRIMETPLS